jgi:hypothetical protein
MNQQHRPAAWAYPSRNSSHPSRYDLTRLPDRFNVVIILGDEYDMNNEQASERLARGKDYEKNI